MNMATKTAKNGAEKSRVRFKKNAQGKKVEAILPIDLYERMVELIEDAEDIRDAEERMKNPDFIPWEEAVKLLDELPDSN
jgi:hypothetical protein